MADTDSELPVFDDRPALPADLLAEIEEENALKAKRTTPFAKVAPPAAAPARPVVPAPTPPPAPAAPAPRPAVQGTDTQPIPFEEIEAIGGRKTGTLQPPGARRPAGGLVPPGAPKAAPRPQPLPPPVQVPSPVDEDVTDTMLHLGVAGVLPEPATVQALARTSRQAQAEPPQPPAAPAPPSAPAPAPAFQEIALPDRLGGDWMADAMGKLVELFGAEGPVLTAAPTNYALAQPEPQKEVEDEDPTVYHPAPEVMAAWSSGHFYDHYKQFIPWLQPIEPDHSQHETEDAPRHEAVACKPPWKSISTKWGPWDTSRLWSLWGNLLPLFLDPGVEEIFVQRILNGPNTTEPGMLAVLSDGAYGLRIHHSLAMPEAKLVGGFGIILASKDKQLYRDGTPHGTAKVESPLELDGSRLTGGVPPSSVGAFAAIRIPARVRPDMAVVVGARKFGSKIRSNFMAPGVPMRPPTNTLLEECKEIVERDHVLYDTMLPVEALEYIECSYLVGLNVIYSGATSAAKTTTLNAACRLMPLHWRVCSVETGVAELYLPHENWVPLFVQPQIGQKEDALDEAGVIRLAMRMSPKTIPVGEVRTAQDMGLYAELSVTGHESSPCTIHSGSPDEALMRFTQGIQGYAGATGSALSEDTARTKAAQVCNVIVQLRRDEFRAPDGAIKSVRRATEIVEVQVTGTFIEGNQEVKLVPIFKTEVDAKLGKPKLIYTKPERCLMWERMRAKFLEHRIPGWA